MNLTFVCLGNICRSPMAEAVLRQLIAHDPVSADWTIASCGTGPWHVGKNADPRTLAVLQKHRVPVAHRARQLQPRDYSTNDLLLAMDEDNLAVLRQRTPAQATARLVLFGSYDPEGVREIADPYYGGDDGFERMYQHITRCCQAFMAQATR